MIRENDRVTVRRSTALEQMRLVPLTGRTGTVMEVRPYNRTPGAMVKLDTGYNGARMWFLPLTALYTDREADVMAKIELLSEPLY